MIVNCCLINNQSSANAIIYPIAQKAQQADANSTKSMAIEIPHIPDSASSGPDARFAIGTVEDLTEYTFAKYAATYFSRNNQSHQFSRRQLKTSLHEMNRAMDEIAARVYGRMEYCESVLTNMLTSSSFFFNTYRTAPFRPSG